ncbi:metal ABC transporter substrate-binding protein [Paenisporosarcina quisquiliarum]|uniref:metal ABC transporter substrate-binding protein n=1 Tax=Paenisporosarcina quisquiliarum TaxID=365346 RepID=UPI0037365461
MRKNLFVLAVISLLLLVGCSQQETLTKAEDNNSNHIGKNASVVVIPTRESILKDGYPTNENGQTYGPNIRDLMLVEPDLISAIGIDGTIGYVKKDDLDGPMPKTPEEAVRLTKEAKPREIPLYDVDGETIIGKFIVGG